MGNKEKTQSEIMKEREYHRKWRAEHPDKVKAAQIRYWEKWRADHPENEQELERMRKKRIEQLAELERTREKRIEQLKAENDELKEEIENRMREQNKITVLEARDISNILGIALANAYKLMKRPDFPAIQVSPRRYIVPEAAFRKWLNDQVEAKKAGRLEGELT